MNVTFLTSSFHTRPVGIHAKFHDIVQYLNVMDDPPFQSKLITCNFDSRGEKEYRVQHSNGHSKGQQVVDYVRAVRRANSETDVFHLNQTDLRLGAPTAVAVKSSVPLVAGPNVSAYHPEVLDETLPLISKKRFLMKLRISKSYRNRLLYHRYSPISRKFDIYLAFTNHHKERLVQSGLSPGKIAVLPSGTRPDIFHPSPAIKTNSTPIFAFVGTPSYWKGFDLFVGALAKLRETNPDFSALVVGSADKQAKQRVTERGLEEVVDFVGWVPRKELPKYYREADVLVNPSRYETEGMTSVEARACGTPVIGSDIAAFEGKNTLTFSGGDINNLYEKLSQFLSNREQYSRTALSTVDEWSVVHSIDKLFRVYSEFDVGDK